jgi:hypothetical protein
MITIRRKGKLKCSFCGKSDKEVVKIAEATVDATRSVLQAQIEELRGREISWDAIGNALGISRQAAWERFS